MTTNAPTDQRVVVTAGHVDHGKTTLLRALTGMEPDRLAEEQRRGMTIDLGYVWCRLDDGPTVAFVDVPGHARYVETMLAGAGAAPVALFVVAADDGWAAQSTEHRDALDLLDIPAVARVVTKAATVDAARLAAVIAELEARTAETSLDGGPIVVTDAVTGLGLDTLREALAHGLSTQEPPRDRDRLRIWIDRSFALAGIGTVVTGTSIDGTVRAGEDGLLLPARRPVRLRRLQALGEDLEYVGPGMRVAANVPGVHHGTITRGDVVATGGPWVSTNVLDATVRVAPGQQLDRRGAWKLHVGTAMVVVQVRPLEPATDPGGHRMVRLLLDRGLPLSTGDRFVIRDTGRRATVAGGTVVDPLPPPLRSGQAARRRHAELLRGIVEAGAHADDRVAALLAAHGGLRPADDLRMAAGLRSGHPLPHRTIEIGEVVLSAAHRDRLVAALRELRTGALDRATIDGHLRRSGLPAPPAAALTEHLVSTGVMARTPGGVSFPEQAAADADASAQRRQAVLAALDAEPFAPPDLDEVTRELGLDAKERAALTSSGSVVRCGKVAFSRTAVELATDRLRDLQGRIGPFTAAAARDALGTSRRYAVPILEHLQRIGATRFDGEVHRLRDLDTDG